jgi:aspartate aminotransferase
MTSTSSIGEKKIKVSTMAENLIGSEILKLAAEINARIKQGEMIYNMTVGDFDPKIFPIPALLKKAIIEAYEQDETNYPPSSGVMELVDAVSYFLKKRLDLSYDKDTIFIAGGARPVIYSIYKAILDQGDKVLYPVPSWNNNHYCHLTGCKEVFVETKAENNFMPTADEIRPYLKDIQLLALCSPLNPTGTTFTEQGLREICELVIEENQRRGSDEKPLYILYDQIYWVLTLGETRHYNPVSLYPELRDYTIFVDGLSKAFAATGVRVGWGFGPKHVIDKMKAILGHVGAWAPKAEQVACAKFLKLDLEIDDYIKNFKDEIFERLNKLYLGFKSLKEQGFLVDAIAPQAAIYLTVELNLKGKITLGGQILSSTNDVTNYILDEAKIGIVPFSAFGSKSESYWYRISIGTCKKQEIPVLLENLEKALKKLS